MKPSDYLITEEDEYKILRERCDKKILDKEIRNNITYIRKELDERFIDKEELKKKIKDSLKILKEKIDSFECAGDELQNEDVLGAYSAFEYILKLLEE